MIAGLVLGVGRQRGRRPAAARTAAPVGADQPRRPGAVAERDLLVRLPRAVGDARTSSSTAPGPVELQRTHGLLRRAAAAARRRRCSGADGRARSGSSSRLAIVSFALTFNIPLVADARPQAARRRTSRRLTRLLDHPGLRRCRAGGLRPAALDHGIGAGARADDGRDGRRRDRAAAVLDRLASGRALASGRGAGQAADRALQRDAPAGVVELGSVWRWTLICAIGLGGLAARLAPALAGDRGRRHRDRAHRRRPGHARPRLARLDPAGRGQSAGAGRVRFLAAPSGRRSDRRHAISRCPPTPASAMGCVTPASASTSRTRCA